MADGADRSIFDHPADFLSLGATLVNEGRGAAAVKLVERMEQERPGDRRLAAVGRAILTRGLPSFHLSMLLDEERNAAYARALELFAPGKRVLDIGTGSGLLAMLAARAGARHVYACEANPMLAETAREIVAANGLAERVTVLASRSDKLDPERDLGGKVDLVVSEILSEDIVSEGVLQSLEDARRRLCVPGARFVPEHVTARIALAACPAIGSVGEVHGFDLARFERHFPLEETVRVDTAGAFARGDPIDLFEFHFAEDRAIPTKGEATATLVSPGSRVSGLLQWLRIELAPGIRYENRPGGDAKLHWQVRYVPFARPRDTAPREPIKVAGLYAAGELLLWENGK